MKRDGEIELELDPARMPVDVGVVFIGRISSPWTERSACPKNMASARESGKAARIEVACAFRQGLDGLSAFSHVVILTWLDRADRNLIVQKPRHAHAARGVFSLRSPVRPNPVGMHVARVVSVDICSGVVGIDAIDVLDGTPVIDLKPYFASTDSIPDARRDADGCA